MAKCIAELKVCKTAAERQWYAFNLTREFSRLWEPDAPYADGTAVRPTGEARKPTGYEYVGDGGQSNGSAEPRWPVPVDSDGASVADGSINWVSRELSFSSLRYRIQACDWSAPAGIVVSDQVETDAPGLQEARITVSGGAAGTTYTCSGIITTQSGLEFEVRLIVQVV